MYTLDHPIGLVDKDGRAPRTPYIWDHIGEAHWDYFWGNVHEKVEPAREPAARIVHEAVTRPFGTAAAGTGGFALIALCCAQPEVAAPAGTASGILSLISSGGALLEYGLSPTQARKNQILDKVLVVIVKGGLRYIYAEDPLTRQFVWFCFNTATNELRPATPGEINDLNSSQTASNNTNQSTPADSTGQKTKENSTTKPDNPRWDYIYSPQH